MGQVLSWAFCMCNATFFLQLPIDTSPIFAIRSQKRRLVTLPKDLHLPVQPGFKNKRSEARACVLNSPLLPHVSVWHSFLDKDPLTEIPLLCFRQPWFIGPAATLVNSPLLRNTVRWVFSPGGDPGLYWCEKGQDYGISVSSLPLILFHFYLSCLHCKESQGANLSLIILSD